MTEDYHIHGGIVDTVNCQGDVHMHGGVVHKMIVQGDCRQFGGIIEQRVIVAGSSAVAQQQTQQAKTQVKHKYRVVYRDRVVVQNNPQQAVIIQKLERENRELREALDNQKTSTPSDDILAMRIRNLENELAKVRIAHKAEVDELKDRLDVACEINAKLRQRGNDDTERRNQQIVEDHIDILATLMCLYPFTPDKDLEFEFGLSGARIRYAAEALGAIKSPEARHEAVEYLQRQHRDMIERRGGDQGNHFTKPVEKVAKNGRVVATYDSVTDAVADNGYCPDTIRAHCKRYGKKTRIYTKDGYTFRYKQ